MYRIYLVEDDAIIARSIKKHLENWEYEVQCTKDFSAVTKEVAEFAPQLVLMDIGLPFYNGYYWCSEIRKISKVPIIFLSSAADNMNIVMAVNMGADDFIAKPFDLSVLTVKVQAMLRRTYDFAEGGEMLTYHGAMLQVAEATLTYQDKKVELTRMAVMNLNNGRLFAYCLLGTITVFTVIYLLVYKMTSRTYYRIVGRQIG